MYTYIHHVYLHTSMYTYIHHVYLHTNMYTYIHHVYLHTSRILTYITYTYIHHVYLHTNMYTYTHLHSHTYMQTEVEVEKRREKVTSNVDTQKTEEEEVAKSRDFENKIISDESPSSSASSRRLIIEL